MDAKTGLNQFCQRYCSRPVTKSDIVYTTTKFGSSQFQAIVKLNCMEGQEYAGELVANPKEAEKSAAQQALQAYSAVITTLSAATKKRKPPAAPAGSQVPMMGGTPDMVAGVPSAGFASGLPGGPPGGPPMAMPGMPGGAPGGVPAGVPDSAAAAAAGDEAENPALTDKVKLNAACMKIAKRALQKGETFYETRQINVGKAPSGYQATVRLSCLPDEWADKTFPGQVCANKQRAEHSAASTALAAIMADPELAALAAKATSPAEGGSRGRGGKSGVNGTGGGKGKGKGWGKGWGKGGWTWSPSGPDLPRERVAEAAITGEVLEWKGTFGWIKPHNEVEHPQASKREGKVWVHRQDLQEGLEALNQGDTVRFQVYADPSGLGAEEVVRF